MEPTSYEKLTTRGEIYSFHIVDNAITNDNSVVILSTVSAQACNFSEGDIVFVKSKNKDTVLIVLTNDDLDCRIAGISPSVRDNLIVRHGDMVIVQSCPLIQGVCQEKLFCFRRLISNRYKASLYFLLKNVERFSVPLYSISTSPPTSTRNIGLLCREIYLQSTAAVGQRWHSSWIESGPVTMAL